MAQKSVLLAGLWTTGDGEIECPLAEDMFFLPQQPFMPLGTLRQQLLFPSGQPSPCCIAKVCSLA